MPSPHRQMQREFKLAEPGGDRTRCRPDPAAERLADLERRSLLAEQARQQAHALRSPLSVVELIAETFQLEFDDDQARADRIERLLTAVSTLSGTLSTLVQSNRFADGPKHLTNVVALAHGVVKTFGGTLANPGHDPESTPGPSPEYGLSPAFSDESPTQDQSEQAAKPEPRQPPRVFVEARAFEAALVHALRLLGADGQRGSALRPVLNWHAQDDVLTLCLATTGPPDRQIPRERVDLQLMAQAATRIVRDAGGSFTLNDDSATFTLPIPNGGAIEVTIGTNHDDQRRATRP